MIKYVYVAGPLSKGDVVLNIREAVLAAEGIIKLGLTPYVPHLNLLWNFIMPHRTYDFWLSLDFQWLQKCDAVLRLPGSSEGAEREVTYATRLGIPVFYSYEELAANLGHGDAAAELPCKQGSGAGEKLEE